MHAKGIQTVERMIIDTVGTMTTMRRAVTAQYRYQKCVNMRVATNLVHTDTYTYVHNNVRSAVSAGTRTFYIDCCLLSVYVCYVSIECICVPQLDM